MNNSEEREIYIYLDFSSRLASDIFNQKNLFFKIVNLDQEHPLVQVGQFVFQGTYEDCVGTNVFFEEVEEGPPNKANTFKEKTPINLKYVTKQYKTLKMHWARLSEEVNPTTEETELYDIKFKDDYETLLQKLEAGTLNFDEIINRNDEYKDDEVEAVAMEVEEKFSTEENKSNDVKPDIREAMQTDLIISNTNTDSETLRYRTLKLMAYEQLKRSIPEEAVTVPAKLRMNYEYYNLKNKLLQGTCFFPFVSLDFDHNTLEGAVDINRCIRQGLIQPSGENPRILTKEEKEAVLTLQNSQNLSIPMRYFVLRALMKKKKHFIKQATEQEILKIDEFGLTLVNSYKLLKAVVNDLKQHIIMLNNKNANVRHFAESGSNICSSSPSYSVLNVGSVSVSTKDCSDDIDTDQS